MIGQATDVVTQFSFDLVANLRLVPGRSSDDEILEKRQARLQLSPEYQVGRMPKSVTFTTSGVKALGPGNYFEATTSGVVLRLGRVNDDMYFQFFMGEEGDPQPNPFIDRAELEAKLYKIFAQLEVASVTLVAHVPFDARCEYGWYQWDSDTTAEVEYNFGGHNRREKGITLTAPSIESALDTYQELLDGQVQPVDRPKVWDFLRESKSEAYLVLDALMGAMTESRNYEQQGLLSEAVNQRLVPSTVEAFNRRIGS